MDIIFIDGLKLHTIIGVYAWEQQKPRPLIVFLELHLDLERACREDTLADTIDYKDVSDVLVDLAATTQFELLERFADEALKRLFARFPAQRIHIRLEKPGAVENTCTVGVQMQRDRLAYSPASNF
jgi:dihydroneopterin aldolase